MKSLALCCRSFPLRFAPEELWENYEHYVVGSSDSDDAFGRGPIRDIAILAPMLRYIGFRAGNPNGVLWTCNIEEPRHLYTCIHLARESGLCRIHHWKPDMCRIYMNCEYPDCESGCNLSKEIRSGFESWQRSPDLQASGHH